MSQLERIVSESDLPVLGYLCPPTAYQVGFEDESVDIEIAAPIADGGDAIEGLPRFGGLSKLETVLVERDVDTVCLAFRTADRGEFFGTLDLCHKHGVNAKVHREYVDDVLTSSGDVATLANVDVEPWDPQDYVFKRVFDVAFASVALVCLAPLVFLITAAIKVDSRGQVLYSQTRTAAFGDVFTIYKFRTMRTGEADTLPDSDENHRITRVGKYLRPTHLDEIPQLWSILVGDMSVVGPRAAWTDEEQHIEADTSEWRKRWFVKPGLTGLAQINGMTSKDPREKLRYDIHYIRNQSFSFDMKIVLRQLYRVFVDVSALLGEKIGRR
jgi:Sugar transferases involved in lipopolysaccharide synthesis